jgi:hypothetical protein
MSTRHKRAKNESYGIYLRSPQSIIVKLEQVAILNHIDISTFRQGAHIEESCDT